MHAANDVSRDMMHSARTCCTVCFVDRVELGDTRRLRLRDTYLRVTSRDQVVHMPFASSHEGWVTRMEYKSIARSVHPMARMQ